MSAYRSGLVFVRDALAGRICETEEGYAFSYDPSWLNSADASAVSLTLPLRSEAYTSATLFSFFDGLIPEGWLLDVAIRNWKLDRRDRFGLLLIACQDCIGNVSIRKEEN